MKSTVFVPKERTTDSADGEAEAIVRVILDIPVSNKVLRRFTRKQRPETYEQLGVRAALLEAAELAKKAHSS